MIDINNSLSKYIEKDEKIILACSGWPDSIYLLYQILESDYKNNLVIAYLDHSIRTESVEDTKLLASICDEYWIIFETKKLDIKKLLNNTTSMSLEEISRKKRYEFLRSLKKKYDARYIFTAHHMDDRIETFFFNLLRGSKLSGLTNMTEISGDILRPLLWITKSQILEYLENNKINFNIDITNYDDDITRNYLRNKIIPNFKRINTSFKKNISNTLNYFEELKNYIDDEVRDFLWDKNYFSVKSFLGSKELIQKEIIRYIYYISNAKSTIWLSESNISEVIKFIWWKNNKTKKEIKMMKLKKDWDNIYFR